MSSLRPLYFPKTPIINEWTQVSALSSHFLSKSKIFQGKLSFNLPLEPEKFKFLVLTSSYLCFQQDQFLNIFNIKWAIVDPFIEETSQSTRYGFTIKLSQTEKFEFFTESARDLDLWLESLGSVTFLSNFESWFYLIKRISSKASIDLYLCKNIYTQSDFTVVRIPNIQDVKMTNLAYNQIAVLLKLNHPNIARIAKLFEDREFFHLVLNCKLFTSLEKIIGTRFDEMDLIVFARKLLEVIFYVHSRGVILRDFKVENIFINKDDFKDFKIVDVAGSYIIGKKRKREKGTFVPCQGPGMKMDIFSAGLILIQLASGVRITESNPKSLAENRAWRKEIGRCWIDNTGKQFLRELVDEDAISRPTASEALSHAWINSVQSLRKSQSDSKMLIEGRTASKLTTKIENY